MKTTLTLEELAQKYRNEIKEVIPAEQWTFREIDYGIFKSEYGKSARETIQELEKELVCPYIVDRFKDHGDRREWRQSLPAEDRELLEDNSLRINHVSTITLMVYLLTKYYNGQNSEKIEKYARQIENQVDGLEDTYDLMSSQEKIEFVRKIKKCAYGLLETFAEESVKRQKDSINR